ncbi:atypical chemokine receptor 4b [Synchiropus splendidus]|uniref:atypical chemokine receptor 4b n=1 Tax=Synchiropus splendidus TaxID=270530 RepID=UPI00237DE16F|nr:atypical chemokine receptor 4b [Synchiropus splendidus]
MEDYEYQDHEDVNDSYYDPMEDYGVCDKATVRSFRRVFLPIIYSLALVVGLAGNTLVVLVYASRLRQRTLTDVCIVNLAVSDLLLLLTLPFWAADAVYGWELGLTACKLASFLYSTNFSCGMLMLACISVDRYRAVAHNTTGRAGSGPRVRRQRILVCAALWALACLLGIPELIFSTLKPSHHRTACISVYPHSMARAAKAALELLEVTFRFLAPFITMLVCYSLVGRALSQAARVQRIRKWRALRVLLAVVAVFLLTQLPYNVVKLCRTMDLMYMLVTDCEVSKAWDHALQVTESLALIHACVNPLLYAFIGSSFRSRVLKAAKHLGEKLSRRPRPGGNEPEVAIALSTNTNHQIQSESSEEQETSNFTM